MQRRWKILSLGLSSAVLASCVLWSKYAYDQGSALDAESRRIGCLHADRPLVLLGGGMAAEQELSKRSLARVEGTVDFLRQERRQRRNLLVVSGGPVYAKTGASEAHLMRQLLSHESWLGPIEIVEEDRSLTTLENARFSAELFESRTMPKEIILLTEVFHLARATRDFERAGFQVCPVSVAGPGK